MFNNMADAIVPLILVVVALGTLSKPMICPGVPSPQGDKRQLELCPSCSCMRHATGGFAGTDFSNPNRCMHMHSDSQILQVDCAVQVDFLGDGPLDRPEIL